VYLKLSISEGLLKKLHVHTAQRCNTRHDRYEEFGPHKDAENAGLENAGPNLQGWKRQDKRVWNAK